MPQSTPLLHHSSQIINVSSSEDDVVTTWDRPRDSFMNYVGYLPRWLGYAFNVTTIAQFYKEGNVSYAQKMLL